MSYRNRMIIGIGLILAVSALTGFLGVRALERVGTGMDLVATQLTETVSEQQAQTENLTGFRVCSEGVIHSSGESEAREYRAKATTAALEAVPSGRALIEALVMARVAEHRARAAASAAGQQASTDLARMQGRLAEALEKTRQDTSTALDDLLGTSRSSRGDVVTGLEALTKAGERALRESNAALSLRASCESYRAGLAVFMGRQSLEEAEYDAVSLKTILVTASGRIGDLAEGPERDALATELKALAQASARLCAQRIRAFGPESDADALFACRKEVGQRLAGITRSALQMADQSEWNAALSVERQDRAVTAKLESLSGSMGRLDTVVRDSLGQSRVALNLQGRLRELVEGHIAVAGASSEQALETIESGRPLVLAALADLTGQLPSAPLREKLLQDLDDAKTSLAAELAAKRTELDAARRLDAGGEKVEQELARAEAGLLADLSRMSDSVESTLNGVVEDTDASANAQLILMVVAGLLATSIGVYLCVSLVLPLQRIGARMREIAEGDGKITTRLPENDRDELGRLGMAFNTFLGKLEALIRRVQATTDTIRSSGEHLREANQDVAAGATRNAAQTQSLSTSAEGISDNVSSVSDGMQELDTAVQQVSQCTTEASTVAYDAVGCVKGAVESINELEAMGKEVERIAQMISGITHQTHMLALNATIEAVRAGEVGKGFAVVASEVKQLAMESTQATNEIVSNLERIRTSSTAAAEQVQSIQGIVNHFSDLQTTIASAVEQQHATAQDMGTALNEAAGGTRSIADGLQQVAGDVGQAQQASGRSSQQTEELLGVAKELTELVAAFQLDE